MVICLTLIKVRDPVRRFRGLLQACTSTPTFANPKLMDGWCLRSIANPASDRTAPVQKGLNYAFIFSVLGESAASLPVQSVGGAKSA